MARYRTTIRSNLSPEAAFAYMADFTHALEWDPTVSIATKTTEGRVAQGSRFDLVARFGGRDVPLTYTVVGFDEPHSVSFEARNPGFISFDQITVRASDDGSEVVYDARIILLGMRRVLAPVMQLLFGRVGKGARAGLIAALNT